MCFKTLAIIFVAASRLGTVQLQLNAITTGSHALSLDVFRSKCVSCVVRCALARRLSIQTRFLCARIRFRSTVVDPNAIPVWSDALSLDACRSKCISVCSSFLSLDARRSILCRIILHLFYPDLDHAIFELRHSSPKLSEI